LIVGYVIGPAIVGVYATIGAVLIMSKDPLAQFIESANTGLAGIIEKGDWKCTFDIRSELFSLAVPCLAVII
jgi:hypothetical protein